MNVFSHLELIAPINIYSWIEHNLATEFVEIYYALIKKLLIEDGHKYLQIFDKIVGYKMAIANYDRDIVWKNIEELRKDPKVHNKMFQIANNIFQKRSVKQ